MLSLGNDKTIITCDGCGKVFKENGKKFYECGWVIDIKSADKTHLCTKCKNK